MLRCSSKYVPRSLLNELTLLNILAGLDNPTGGEARWRDQARWPRSPPETFPVAAFRKVKQQRVAIARAIAKRADNLLCDEPAGALDYPAGKIVLEALARANKELRTTGVVISHNAAIAEWQIGSCILPTARLPELK